MRRLIKGVWLDNRTAKIISIQGKAESIEYLYSEIDESHPKGGSGTAIPYAHQDAISEKTYLERRKQQQNKYYQKIINQLRDCDWFMLMGPAEAKIALGKLIMTIPGLKDKLLDIETVDSITDNQLIAMVRDTLHHQV